MNSTIASRVGAIVGVLLLILITGAACGATPSLTVLTPSPAAATLVPQATEPMTTPLPPPPTATSILLATDTVPTPLPPTATASSIWQATDTVPTPLPPSLTPDSDRRATDTVPTPSSSPPGNSSLPPDHLALGMRTYDQDFVSSFAQSGDIFGVRDRGGLDYVARLLSPIPKENRMLIFPTLDGLEEILDSLTVEISYIGFDLERWPATSTTEQEDPVEAVKRAREIAHARGLKLVIGPSRYFNEEYGTQLAPYVEVYMPQAKFYQARLSDEEYAQVVRQLILDLRQANPNMLVFLDISPSPKDIEETPAEMLERVESVRDVIDGVWVTYDPTETEQVGEFVKLLGR